MSHKEPDGDSCKNYFKYGKSFPDNVQDALCDTSGILGSTGPTGPVGSAGPSGSGVFNAATVQDILNGVNGLSTDRSIPTYVDPYGWHYASHQFAPLIETKTLANTNFIPDALNTVIFDITYNGTVSISAPKNMSNGRTITICLRQGEGGNHRLEWDPIFHFDGGYKFITETEGSKDVMVGTKINDFIFSTLASDCKNSDSTVLGSSSVITY